MRIDNVPNLKIYKLSEEQYKRKAENGEIEENAFYFTPGGDESAGGPAIIDVIELPTEDIQENTFYRLLTGSVVRNGLDRDDFTCLCVEGLPEIGESAFDQESMLFTVYFNTQDREVYGYVDSMLSMALSAPAGWYPVAVLFGAIDGEYGGVINDISEDPRDGLARFLVSKTIYQYSGKWVSMKMIGSPGTGRMAETFNHPMSQASGDYSHAEGAYSHAQGESSHAEGNISHAQGDYSHAEGYSTHAEGECSHAEGVFSHAEGNYSHAEGYHVIAEGNSSHAEGHYTIARGDDQHVQGRYNIEDAEGKYAHIVGNGTGITLSNAHTLDWDGNAWYAGTVEATAMIIKSPNGTRFKITVDDNGYITASKDI